MKRIALALAVLTSVVNAEPLPDKTTRVVETARVWAKVKFFHPYLAYKNIDWDAAFIAALPKVEAATTLAQYSAAIDGMLAPLADPVTRIAPPAAEFTAASATPTEVEFLTTSKDVVVIDLAAFTAGGWDYTAFAAKGKRALTALARARGAVVDLRGAPAWIVEPALENFSDALPAITTWPSQRIVVHHGFATQDGQTSGGYYSELSTIDARPITVTPPTKLAHVVFIVDATSGVPTTALALQASGRATLVASAALDDASSVKTIQADLAGDLHVRIRIGELLTGPVRADVVATGDLRARAVTLAAKPPARRTTKAAPALPAYRPHIDDDYAAEALPTRPLRILAAVRVWATLAHFNPYQYLVTNWDAAFIAALGKLETVSDARGYIETLHELSVKVGDGHTNVRGPTPVVRGAVDASLRLVEKQLTVMRVGANVPLVVGDVIETIDGKPTAAVMQAQRPLISGSTVDAREQRIAAQLLLGEMNSTVTLGVRGAKGARTVTATRGPWSPPKTERVPWKLLPGNVGYVDLRVLLPNEIDAMFTALGTTKALVFDMRGYPNGVAWALAPRLNVRGAKLAAQFLQPLVSEGQEMTPGVSTRFFQELAATPPSVYRGKVAVLIDDRAISQSEHTCLFLKEAAGATFIGSPTHGANGDITVVRLPGGVRMTFTGQEVRHVDGTRLQQVGITPTIAARPTIAGIRAGKDELLERALAWATTGK